MTKDDNGVTLPSAQPSAQASGVLNAALEAVGDALTRVRFGAVHLTVHDGKVVQIDVTERTRLNG